MIKNKKTKKLWHNYFANILKLLLSKQGFKIETEVEVGKMPLKIDVVIIKKYKQKFSTLNPEIFFTFKKINIGEYKAPDDKLDIESIDKLFGYAYFYKVKNLIKSWEQINVYAFVSGEIEKVKNYFKNEYNKELKQKSNGIYHLNLGFDFYLIRLDELPVTRENLELLLFSSANKKEILIELFEKSKKELTELLTISYELFDKEIKEVMKMITKAKINRVNKELLKIMVKNIDKKELFQLLFNNDEIIERVGPEKILKKILKNQNIKDIMKNKIVKTIGKDEIVKTIGEDEVVKVIGVNRIKKILNELENSKKKTAVKNQNNNKQKRYNLITKN